MKAYEGKLHKALCEKSFHAFCFGVENPDGSRTPYLYTKDEHDIDNPIKPFPDQYYLRVIADLLVVSSGSIKPAEATYALNWGVPYEHLQHLSETRKLAIEKSRQLKITWIVLAYLLWRAKHYPHQLIMVQSKRALDAYALVCERRGDATSRLAVMEDNLPPFLKSLDFAKTGVALKGNLIFPNGSMIVAIPEGGSKIRSRTPSILFSDEAAFQPEFGDAYKAAIPAITGGGQAVFVSSAEISEFQNLVGAEEQDVLSESQVDMTMIHGGMRAGLTTRIADNSDLFVCRLHYSADPEKNPLTDHGARWMHEAVRGYPGGVEGPGWRKEMEIEYGAGGGEFVFRNFRKWRVDSGIFIDHNEADLTRAKLWASYDHGFVNPCCYLVHAVYPRDGQLWYQTLWELYASGLHVPEISQIILGKSITSSDGRHIAGNPYANMEVIKIADPEIDRRTQVTSQAETKRVIDLFAGEGVIFTKGESGDDVTVADYMLGVLWKDPMNPRYQIARRCERFIWELSRLQHKTHKTLAVAHTKNAPEGIVDRDNHAWDAWKYFIKRFPMGYVKDNQAQTGGSYSWWTDMARHPAGKPVLTTYRRGG